MSLLCQKQIKQSPRTKSLKQRIELEPPWRCREIEGDGVHFECCGGVVPAEKCFCADNWAIILGVRAVDGNRSFWKTRDLPYLVASQQGTAVQGIVGRR